MARPEKDGLDYFSMDVEKDNKLKLLKAKFGTIGFGMYVELLQYIYKNGYYILWSDDNMLLFLLDSSLKEEEMRLMLEFMIEKELFSKHLYKKYNILTSTGIQKRYVEGTRKRKSTTVQGTNRLLGEFDHITIELKEELTQLKEELTPLMLEVSTQSKVKESKVKETKEKTISYSEDFEKFRIAYPIKKGKSEGYDAYLKAIKKTNPEIILAGAIKYSAEVKASGTTYIKRPQGRLNNRRREDEGIDPTPGTNEQWITEFSKLTGRAFAEKYGHEKWSEINDLIARQI